jgi:hypothetical protein
MEMLKPSSRIGGLLALLVVVVARVPLGAQVVRTDPARIWAADSVIARFESDIRMHVVNSQGLDAVAGILMLPGVFAARQDSLLNGLERLAVTSNDSNVRRRAAYWIAFAGTGGRAVSPVKGVCSRLARIYRARDDAGVRLAIRNGMPLQAERRAAAAFLRSLAVEPDSSGGNGVEGYFSIGDPRTEALARLAEMGEEGRAVLQAMHRSGEARSPQARMILDDMARRGFPVRDIALMQQERDRARFPR